MTPQLLRAATGCTQDAADLYAEHLSAACEFFGINTPQRLAAFLGQIGHESGSLRHVREVWGPTPAQQRYEGRADLGNTEPGDGYRYRGRGLIQATGRDNYRRVTRWLADVRAPDFERAPELLEEPRWAAWSAAAWWSRNRCNELADAGDIVGLGRLINRGSSKATQPANGEADRIQRTERARQALGVDTSEQRVDLQPSDRQATDPTQTDPPAPPEPTQERPMAAPLVFLKAALPFLVEAIPKLGKLFGSGSEVSERNVKAAELVAATVTQSIGASSLEEAVTKLKDDPAAVQAATKALDAIWFELTEVGGGIQEAHKRDMAYVQPGGPRFWESPAFWISLILVALPVMVLADMLFVHPESYSENLRTQIVTATLALLTVVGAYWLGTSASSQRKTDMLAK